MSAYATLGSVLAGVGGVSGLRGSMSVKTVRKTAHMKASTTVPMCDTKLVFEPRFVFQRSWAASAALDAETAPR